MPKGGLALTAMSRLFPGSGCMGWSRRLLTSSHRSWHCSRRLHKKAGARLSLFTKAQCIYLAFFSLWRKEGRRRRRGGGRRGRGGGGAAGGGGEQKKKKREREKGEGRGGGR